jgi:hypothetical protein
VACGAGAPWQLVLGGRRAHAGREGGVVRGALLSAIGFRFPNPPPAASGCFGFGWVFWGGQAARSSARGVRIHIPKAKPLGGFGTRRAAPKPLGFFASARPYSKKILPKFCSSKVHCALLSPDRALLLQEQKKICSKKRPKISSSEKKCLTLCCRTTHPRIVGNVGAVRFQRLNFVTRVDAI